MPQSTPKSGAERVAEHRARKKTLPPIRRFLARLRQDGFTVPSLYDQTSRKLADQMAKDIARLENRAERLNARLAKEAAQIPDPEVRLRVLGELDRSTRIQVSIY